MSTGDLTDIQTKLVLCYSALLTIQDLAKGCTGPYLAKSWTGPYLRHRTSLETGLDLPYDTGLRLRRDWTLLTIHDPVWDGTGPYVGHRTLLGTGLDLTHDTGPCLGLDWTLLTAQDLTWGWTGPYDTGPRLRRDWTLLRAQDLTWVWTELDLTCDTGPRLGLEWTLLTAQDLTWGWTGPYDTGLRLRGDWTVLTIQDLTGDRTGPSLGHRTLLRTWHGLRLNRTLLRTGPRLEPDCACLPYDWCKSCPCSFTGYCIINVQKCYLICEYFCAHSVGLA